MIKNWMDIQYANYIGQFTYFCMAVMPSFHLLPYPGNSIISIDPSDQRVHSKYRLWFSDQWQLTSHWAITGICTVQFRFRSMSGILHTSIPANFIVNGYDRESCLNPAHVWDLLFCFHRLMLHSHKGNLIAYEEFLIGADVICYGQLMILWDLLTSAFRIYSILTHIIMEIWKCIGTVQCSTGNHHQLFHQYWVTR